MSVLTLLGFVEASWQRAMPFRSRHPFLTANCTTVWPLATKSDKRFDKQHSLLCAPDGLGYNSLVGSVDTDQRISEFSYAGEMMKKADVYRQTLGSLSDWDAYLVQESRLPGPRANLELAHVVAEEGDRALFKRYLAFDADRAPTNTPQEFLAFCGVLGLGKLCAEGEREALPVLRRSASDPRWRIREAVAMALQRLAKADMHALLWEMEIWSQGNLLEKRAAAAGLCHPDLLQEKDQAERVLQIVDAITASVLDVEDRKTDDFKALRKGLGYCWSVAVSALPEPGKALMERWFACDDPDIGWIMKQNLSKKRLERADAAWVTTWKAQLGRR
jgi:hypothetical protein